MSARARPRAPLGRFLRSVPSFWSSRFSLEHLLCFQSQVACLQRLSLPSQRRWPVSIVKKTAAPLSQPKTRLLTPTMVHLATAKYGKDKVRVSRIVRNSDGTHDFVEYIIRALLEGDVERAWTHSDNSSIVATDSIK